VLNSLGFDIARLLFANSPGGDRKLFGVGKAIASKMLQYLAEGRIDKLDVYQATLNDAAAAAAAAATSKRSEQTGGNGSSSGSDSKRLKVDV
jgi:hypothetical protein